jgi:hypothetical protein
MPAHIRETTGALPMLDHALTIRAATPSDAKAVARLARLDGRPELRGDALLAERHGTPVAAVALTSGSVVADPFQATADAVHSLRLRRYRLLRQGGDVGRARPLLRRLAAQPVGHEG